LSRPAPGVCRRREASLGGASRSPPLRGPRAHFHDLKSICAHARRHSFRRANLALASLSGLRHHSQSGRCGNIVGANGLQRCISRGCSSSCSLLTSSFRCGRESALTALSRRPRPSPFSLSVTLPAAA
jgi:hypothetical protein